MDAWQSVLLLTLRDRLSWFRPPQAASAARGASAALPASEATSAMGPTAPVLRPAGPSAASSSRKDSDGSAGVRASEAGEARGWCRSCLARQAHDVSATPAVRGSRSTCALGPNRAIPPRRFPSQLRLLLVLLLLLVLAGQLLWDDLYAVARPLGRRVGPVVFAAATTVHYRGSVYHGLTEDMIQRGGGTFSIQVSIPTFPTNISLVRPIMTSILLTNVRLIDDAGTVVHHVMPTMPSNAMDEWNRTKTWPSWRRAVSEILQLSDIEVSPTGHAVKVTLASGRWVLPAHTSALIVPCLPFSLFEQVGRLGLQDMPNNCLAGDPFLVRKRSFLQLDEARWNASRQLFITGGAISIPLKGAANTVSDKFALERRLRVMEGYTCLHTRSAFVRGSRWDIHESVYRFTPHRGGVQTLCYAPYPETLPFLRVKLMNSYEVAGPEGVSTDPPQVHAELEFTGTIYGTNLTERDTAVITDELCTDFTSQNVFFVDLFFSSSSRVSFFGTFHKRGIYHVCYHREESPVYVRVSTLLVERGTDVVIDNDSPNVLIDQDVKLLQSASVTRLKVQDKGHLNLRRRSLNVSYFVWSGGSISGKGTINCTGYAKITTQGYETRQLSVPLYNYGEMTIDVQRLSMERDGAIHNYGNLTLAVSSMGMDSISSVLSAGRRNAITNYPGGVLRIIALDERSHALLTGRFIFQGGAVLLSGKINITDASSTTEASLTLKSGTLLTAHNVHLGGNVQVEERSVLTLMEGCVFISSTVTGDGVLRLLGDDTVLNSLKVEGTIRTLFGIGLTEPISVVVYGTVQFGEHTLVHVANATFVTSTGLAKVMLLGRLLVDFVTARFTGNMILHVGGMAAMYGNMSDDALGLRRTPAATPSYALPLATSSIVAPNATMFVIDISSLHELEAESPPPTPPPSATAATLEPTASPAARADVSASLPSVFSPFQDSTRAWPSNPSGEGAPTRPCQVYLPTSQYLTMSGRLLLRGCLQVPSGGIITGAVAKLERAEDWALLYEAFCFSPEPETLPHLCRRHRRFAPPMRSGLALSEKVYLRAPATVMLDELTLAHSQTRVVDTVRITVSDSITVRGDSTLYLAHATTLVAPHIVVEGTLVVNEPRRAVLRGQVEMKRDGLIEVHGVAGPVCVDDLAVVGAVVPAKPDGRVRVRCLASSEDDGPGAAPPPGPDGQPVLTDLAKEREEQRRRVLANLRPDMECPEDVVRDYDARRSFIILFWLREPYDPPADQPMRRDMLWMSLFGLACGIGTLHVLLSMWGFTYREWWADLQLPCPLQLTLTWDELSHSAVNYFSFCRLTVISFQNTVAAFHPGLPAPLPSVAGVFMQGMRLLMPHHQRPFSWARKVGMFYIVWLTLFVCMQKWSTPLVAYVRRRQPFLLDVAPKLYTGLTILNFIFLASLMSSVVDTIAWPTLLRGVPTYEDVRLDVWVGVSVIAFISMGVMAPSSILTNQMRLPNMDLRVRASIMFLYFSVQMWETVMWKVFYSNPLLTVFNCVAFQLLRLLMIVKFPPTAYRNVNRFMAILTMQSFFVYPTIILYTVLVRTGVYTDCTQGTGMFRVVSAVFAITLFVNFWRNVLFVEEQTTTTRDVSIDALRCSMVQIRNRIHDLKSELYACTDTLERENVLNAIARLRIEYQEKQERYRFETHRLLRPYILGRSGSNEEQLLQGHSTTSSFSHYDLDDPSNMLPIMSPNMQHSSLLTMEEMETFSCGPALGKGSYGTVHLGILTNGKLVAVKYVNVVSESPEALASVKAEVNMLRELSHPNIIRYFGAHTIDDTMLVFMEFAVGGSLTSIVRKFTHLTEAVMQLYSFQILRGLQYLHEKGVVHRDIKGENILIDGYGVAKLADFGCSKSLANIANASQGGCGTLVGSPFWMAPEVIRSEAYGTKADIWSVGCTVVEMLNGGEPPWREEFDNVYSAMFYVGSTNDIPQIPEETSDQCRDFLFRCFERDVMRRASADELLQHPWLRAAASAVHTDDSSDNFPSFSNYSSPSLRTTHDGRRSARLPRGSPHSSREDLTTPQNGHAPRAMPNGSIASTASGSSRHSR